MKTLHFAENAYRIMWLFVFFDLPVISKSQRRHATQFRNKLLDDGFTMMQFSVYTRHCANKENAEAHIERVKKAVPSEGYVSILAVTDKQFGKIINVMGKKAQAPPQAPKQLEMF